MLHVRKIVASHVGGEKAMKERKSRNTTMKNRENQESEKKEMKMKGKVNEEKGKGA